MSSLTTTTQSFDAAQREIDLLVRRVDRIFTDQARGGTAMDEDLDHIDVDAIVARSRNTYRTAARPALSIGPVVAATPRGQVVTPRARILDEHVIPSRLSAYYRTKEESQNNASRIRKHARIIKYTCVALFEKLAY